MENYRERFIQSIKQSEKYNEVYKFVIASFAEGEIIDELIIRNRFFTKYPERKDKRDMLTFIDIYYETITQGLLEDGKLRRIAGGFVVQNLEKNNQEQELTK